jgi:hypothetical protein
LNSDNGATNDTRGRNQRNQPLAGRFWMRFGSDAIPGTCCDSVLRFGTPALRQAGYRKFKRPFRAVWRVGGGRVSACLGSECDVRTSGFGFAGPLIGAVRGPLSPIPGSGPSAALRGHGRIRAIGRMKSRARFALGPSTALRSGVETGGRTQPQRAVRVLNAARVAGVNDRRLYSRSTPRSSSSPSPSTRRLSWIGRQQAGQSTSP